MLYIVHSRLDEQTYVHESWRNIPTEKNKTMFTGTEPQWKHNLTHSHTHSQHRSTMFGVSLKLWPLEDAKVWHSSLFLAKLYGPPIPHENASACRDGTRPQACERDVTQFSFNETALF